jgi:hypothetical protein
MSSVIRTVALADDKVRAAAIAATNTVIERIAFSPVLAASLTSSDFGWREFLNGTLCFSWCGTFCHDVGAQKPLCGCKAR